MQIISKHFRGLRQADWLLPTLLFLMIMLGTLGPGSYFLHFDTPTLSQNAADLVLSGCWGPSGKPGVSLLLSIPFLVGGVNPLWDMAMLTLLGMATLSCFYSLAKQVTNSRRWALLGTLWFISLPSILYYTRIHMGYPLAFFLMGITFQTKKRYGWAGLAFGMVTITHTNFLVPLAAWLGASFLMHTGKGRIRNFARVGVAFLFPILVLEIVRFLFMGQMFAWSLNVFSIVQRHGSRTYQTTWAHIPVLTGVANGWLNGLLLALGIVYPGVRERRDSLPDAIYLAGWLVVAAYSLWTGIWHKELVPRMITGVYPMLAIMTLLTMMKITRRIGIKLTAPMRPFYRLAGILIVIVVLPSMLIDHLLDANIASRTAYPQIEEMMIRAADAGLPVRYFGNFHVGYFYALEHQVETSINETSLDLITGDTRAVMIFENVAGHSNPLQDALENDPRIDLADYDISTFSPHFTAYRPSQIEGRLGTAGMILQDRTLPSPRSGSAVIGSVTVWWPREPSGTFHARHEPLEFIFYYNEGCITPHRFGEQNYYDLLSEKAVILWNEFGAGDFQEMIDLIFTWIRE